MVPDLRSLKNLEVALFSNNMISNFPSLPRKLRVLKLTNNLITRISPTCIEKLVNLEVLHIDKNHFSKLPTTIYKLKNLNELALEWFNYVSPRMDIVQNGPSGIKHIGRLFRYCQLYN